MLAAKYCQAKNGVWKYGIEIIDASSNAKPDCAAQPLRSGGAPVASTEVDVAFNQRPEVILANHDITKSSIDKAKCELCLGYFPLASVSACSTMKNVVLKKREWGIEMQGKRYSAASFLYSRANLCVFCAQLLGPPEARDDLESGSVASPLGRHAGTRSEIDRIPGPALPPSVPEENLAFGKAAFMSSLCDGLGPELVVDGAWSNRPKHCCRTMREMEPWWEVDLGQLCPIGQVRVLCRTGNSAAHHMAPFWIMVSRHSILKNTADNAAMLAVMTHRVAETDASGVATWDLPPNTVGSTIRVQCEGIRSLQLGQVVVAKGGVTVRTVSLINASHARGGQILQNSASFAELMQARADLPGTAASGRPDTSASAARSRSQLVSRSRRPATGVSADEKLKVLTVGDCERIGLAPAGSPVRRRHRRLMKQPSDSVVANVSRSSRIRPQVRANLRIDINDVDSLFWKTAVRYDLSEEHDAKMEAARSLLGDEGIGAVCAFFLTCKPVAKQGSLNRKTRRLHSGSPTDEPGGFAPLRLVGEAPEFEGTEADLECLTVQLDKVCRNLRRLGMAIMPFKSRRQEEKRRKGQKKKLRSWQEVLAKFVKIDSLSLNTFADEARHVAADNTLELFWTQIVLFFGCILSEDVAGVRGAIAMPENRAPPPMVDHGEARLKVLEAHKQRTMASSKDLEHIGARSPHIIQQSSNCVNHVVLLRSERAVRSLAQTYQGYSDTALRPDGEPWLLDEFDYSGKLQRRTQRLRKLHETMPAAMISPNRRTKPCALCKYRFSAEAAMSRVTMHALLLLLKRLDHDNDEIEKFETRMLASKLSKYHPVSVCAFCLQFFDTDATPGQCGLAKTYPKPSAKNYQQFFDDRYPGRHSTGEESDADTDAGAVLALGATELGATAEPDADTLRVSTTPPSRSSVRILTSRTYTPLAPTGLLADDPADGGVARQAGADDPVFLTELQASVDTFPSSAPAPSPMLSPLDVLRDSQHGPQAASLDAILDAGLTQSPTNALPPPGPCPSSVFDPVQLTPTRKQELERQEREDALLEAEARRLAELPRFFRV